jgi:O-antigen/teichoic acid export membrane protein
MADPPKTVTGGAARPGRPAPEPGRTYGIVTLFKDSFIYGAGRLLQKFLSMLLLPLYTSYLTPKDYGVLGMVLITIAAIDVLVSLGWDGAFTRFYFDKRSEEHHRGVINQTLLIDTVYPAVLLLGFVAIMPWLSNLIMGSSGYTIYFDIALLNEFFVNINDLPLSLMRVDHKPRLFFAFTAGRILVQVPLTVVLVAGFHMGVMGVLVGILVTSIAMNLATLPTWIRRIHLKLDSPLFREMFLFSIANFPASAAFYVLNFSDRYLVRHFATLTAVGLYTASFTLAQPVYFAGVAFRLAWPQWHYSWLHDPAKHKRQVARGYTYFILLSTMMITAVGVFLPLMIRVLLRNQQFWSIGGAVLILAVSTSFYNSYQLFVVGVNVTKKNRYLPVPVIIAAALNVGLNIIFLPRYGYIAAAWATLVGFALLAVLMRFLSEHYYPIPHEWGRVAKLALATTLTLLLAWGLARLDGLSVSMPFNELLLRQLLSVPVLLVFPLTIWATRFFRPQEVTVLRRMAHQALHPLATRRSSRVAAAAGGGALEVPPAAAAPATDDDEAALADIRLTEDQLVRDEKEMDDAWKFGDRDDMGGSR